MKDELMNHSKIPSFLIRIITGNNTRSDNVKFQEWIAENSENQKVFNEFKSLWGQLELPESNISNTNDQWQKLIRQIKPEGTPVNVSESISILRKPIQSSFSYSRKAWMVAASIVLIGLLVYKLVLPVLTNRMNTLAAGNRQQTTLRLPDGSEVILNSGSKLIYPKRFSSTERIVQLEGEAFFDIRQNDDCPFIIKTGEARISSFGTAINVWSRDNETRVAAQMGEVTVHSPEHTNPSFEIDECVLLSENQMSSIKKNERPNRPLLIKISDATDWLDNRFVFRSASLKEVVRELEMYYDIAIYLENTELGQLTITAFFEGDSLDSILDAISLALDLKYTADTNEITFYAT